MLIDIMVEVRNPYERKFYIENDEDHIITTVKGEEHAIKVAVDMAKKNPGEHYYITKTVKVVIGDGAGESKR